MEKTPEGDIRAVERSRLEYDDKEAMGGLVVASGPEIPVALEATFGWPWVADLLEELGHPVHLAHPPTICAWRNTKPRPTAATATGWASFNSAASCRRSHPAPPEVRQRRERTRYRMPPLGVANGRKDRAAAVLHRHGILHDFSDLFGKAGRVAVPYRQHKCSGCKRPPQHVGIVGFIQTAKCCRTTRVYRSWTTS